MADNVLHSVSALYNFFSLKNCKSFKFEPEMLFQKKNLEKFQFLFFEAKITFERSQLEVPANEIGLGLRIQSFISVILKNVPKKHRNSCIKLPSLVF